MKIKAKCRKCGILLVMPFSWWVRWKLSIKRKEQSICIGCSER